MVVSSACQTAQRTFRPKVREGRGQQAGHSHSVASNLPVRAVLSTLNVGWLHA